MTGPLAYYLHDLNPVIFEWGFLSPRWYGFSYLMGFVCAYLLIKKLARDGMLHLPMEKIPDLVLNCCIFGVLIGGRLGFCLFYDLPRALHDNATPLLWSFGGDLPWWGVLRVNGGGMSAHGGVVFTILTLIWFTWKHNRSLQSVRGFDVVMKNAPSAPAPTSNTIVPNQRASLVNIGDAACMVVPIGLFFGRLANFVNGELYGHVTDKPWGVKFPSEIYAPTNGVSTVNPVLIERLRMSVARIYDFPLEKLDNYQLASMVHRHDGAGAYVREQLALILPARHPSQLYEAGLEGLLLFAIVWTVGRLWKKDGMAGGEFLVGYPIMRILGEQFRVGDTPVNILGLNISKGVLYSLLMLIPAAAYWLYWIRRNQAAVWVKPKPAEAVSKVAQEARK